MHSCRKDTFVSASLKIAASSGNAVASSLPLWNSLKLNKYCVWGLEGTNPQNFQMDIFGYQDQRTVQSAELGVEE
jgi:hypothetical protein